MVKTALGSKTVHGILLERQGLGDLDPLFERLRESEFWVAHLQDALAKLGFGDVGAGIERAHRADPNRGVRGSMLLVSVRSAGLISKLRLLDSSLLSHFKDKGLGILSLQWRPAEAGLGGSRRAATLPARPEIPDAKRLALLALIQAQDH
ncbi:MAG: hypothetical protein RLY67_486 [Pseudomonadota bacterium]